MKDKRKLLIIRAITFISDIFLVYLSFYFAYWIRFNIEIIPVTKSVPSFAQYQRALPVVVIVWLIIFIQNHIYQLKRSHLSAYDELFKIAKVISIGTIIVMAVTFLYREFSYSRVVTAYAWFLGILFLFTSHQIFKWLEKNIIRQYGSKSTILIIGNGKIANNLKETLDRNHTNNMQYGEEIDYKRLRNTIKKYNITDLIMAKSPVAHSDVLSVSQICEEDGIEFRLVPDLLELRMGELVIDDYFGMPTVQLKPLSLYGINFYIKRSMDIVFSIVFLTIFFLPLLLICFFIKIDTRGPILYVQRRMGYMGRHFLFFKFRSMIAEADSILEGLKHLSEREGPVFKMKDDPRITKTGRFLRRYSLDEIPQILSILRGDMSLVGPRPQVIWEAEYYDEWAKRRLRILPGITGLWQVSGRSDLSYEEMIRLDIYYIENWSLGLDLKIILKTVPAMLSKRGAY